MANNKMLIDASHPEETRVVVLRGNRIEEFDFESASKKPLRGNIYLAKVTRVEPSLQAAFIEYGGNRHGFLAFSEIHPDYYQIPVADRQALLEEEAREHRDEEDAEESRRERPAQQSQQQRRGRRFRRNGNGDRNAQRSARGDDVISADAPQPDIAGFGGEPDLQPARESDVRDLTGHETAGQVTSGQVTGGHENGNARLADGNIRLADDMVQSHQAVEQETRPEDRDAVVASQDASPHEAAPVHRDEQIEAPAAQGDEPAHGAPAHHEGAGERSRDEVESIQPELAFGDEPAARAPVEHDDEDEDADEEEEEPVEQLGGDEFEESRPVRRTRRQYKIQEVIKRRQVLLVQVVKEERGNKGAALTTYLSLAGRYSVLMPNTARGGGISRKITDGDDRKRLREIAEALDVPEGMGVILRTAGAARGREEVQRDFEYLLRMWESVRELTLRSMAPALVYEEGSLIKRSIRDLYGKDIDEVTVSGGEGFKEARDFMGMLMPTHVNSVREWRDPQPVFAKLGVEQQLDSMFSNVVTLKSGGYIVVNQTEALVAIDVNSGRSTREHNIEDTALRTNLEAADEVARQLRLRDLAGLIVVDFIDMEEFRNNRSVERRMKDALKNDRARIQVGRISHFGLLEMSRQRMRTGVLEGSSIVCPHCMGAGTVRSTASIALHVLRLIEDSLIRNNQFNMTLRTRTEVALYILNQKRAHLRELEERFGIALTIAVDDHLTGSTYHAIERGEPAVAAVIPVQSRPQQIRVDTIAPVYDEEEPAESEDVSQGISSQGVSARSTPAQDADADDGDDAPEGGEDATDNAADGDSEARRRRRRRRRGGRNRESSGIEADAPQPSDDLLAVVAEFTELTPAQPAPRQPAQAGDGDSEGGAQGGEDDGSFQGRRGGRRRRGGRGRDGDFAQRSAESGAGAAQNGNWVRSGDTGPDYVHSETAEVAPDTVYTPSAAPTTEVEPEPARETAREAARETVRETVSETTLATAETPDRQAPAPHAPDVSFEPPAREPAYAAPAANPAPAGVSAAAEAAARHPTELLPEAPAPEQKRGGWWQRARNALGS